MKINEIYASAWDNAIYNTANVINANMGTNYTLENWQALQKIALKFDIDFDENGEIKNEKMRPLKPAEDLKVCVYEDLTAPDTVITINDDNKWEIQIMREESLVFDTTDEFMENIQTNLEETPLYVWEEVREELERTYTALFGKYWRSNVWEGEEWLDTESMTAGEIEQEEARREEIDFITNWIMDTKEREKMEYGYLENDKYLLRDF